MNWYAALEFSGVRPDLVSEETFRSSVTPATHSLVVAPYRRFVQSAMWNALRKYVENGGCAVVTKGSFEKTFDKWEDCGFGEWAKKASPGGRLGKGKVFVSADAMAFQPFRIEHEGNAALLANIMGWLLDTPVDDSCRKAFKDGLFLVEKDLKDLEITR